MERLIRGASDGEVPAGLEDTAALFRAACGPAEGSEVDDRVGAATALASTTAVLAVASASSVVACGASAGRHRRRRGRDGHVRRRGRGHARPDLRPGPACDEQHPDRRHAHRGGATSTSTSVDAATSVPEPEPPSSTLSPSTTVASGGGPRRRTAGARPRAAGICAGRSRTSRTRPAPPSPTGTWPRPRQPRAGGDPAASAAVWMQLAGTGKAKGSTTVTAGTTGDGKAKGREWRGRQGHRAAADRWRAWEPFRFPVIGSRRARGSRARTASSESASDAGLVVAVAAHPGEPQRDATRDSGSRPARRRARSRRPVRAGGRPRGRPGASRARRNLAVCHSSIESVMPLNVLPTMIGSPPGSERAEVDVRQPSAPTTRPPLDREHDQVERVDRLHLAPLRAPPTGGVAGRERLHHHALVAGAPTRRRGFARATASSSVRTPGIRARPGIDSRSIESFRQRPVDEVVAVEVQDVEPHRVEHRRRGAVATAEAADRVLETPGQAVLRHAERLAVEDEGAHGHGRAASARVPACVR